MVYGLLRVVPLLPLTKPPFMGVMMIEVKLLPHLGVLPIPISLKTLIPISEYAFGLKRLQGACLITSKKIYNMSLMELAAL